ncbi:MAG: O-antigen ligase family protein [Alphaproteobacteria bacterium]
MQAQNFLILKWLVFFVVFACLPFPHGNIYPFALLMAACLHSTKKYQISYQRVDWHLIAFLFWGGISVFWANDVLMTLKIYAKVVFIMLGGVLWFIVYNQLDQEKKYIVKNIVFVASLLLLFSLLVFVINIKFGGSLFKVIAPHVSPALVHASIACSLAIWSNLFKLHKLVRSAILILAIFTLQFATSDAAALGIFLGAATLLMHKFLPNFLRFMFIYGMPIVWFFMPFTFCLFTVENYHQWASSLDPSYTHRLFIWNSVVNQIFERFWTGFGFGSSRFKDFGLKAEEVLITIGNNQQILDAPVHPHNYMLQIWLELGFIGVLLASLLWIVYWNKRYQKVDSYCIAFWASALCVAVTSISVWQSWWLFLMVILLPIYSFNNSNVNASRV